MGQEYQSLFARLHQMPNVVGVWAWNQQGGWGFGKHVFDNFGFNFWNELNAYTTGKLLDGENDLQKIIADFLNAYHFSTGQKKVLTDIILSSRSVVQNGWYVKPFAQKTVFFNKIALPPLLWIWWDQVTASPLILAKIYLNGDLPVSVQNSKNALAVLQAQQNAWQKVADGSTLSQNITVSMEDEYRILDILRLYKTYIWNYFTFGNGGDVTEIKQKIATYQMFLSQNGNNFRFDFSEISPLFRLRQSVDFKTVYGMFLFAVLGGYIYIFFRKRSALIQYIQTKHLLVLYMAILCILFVTSLIINPEDFFWYFIRMGILLSLLISGYLYFYRRIAIFL